MRDSSICDSIAVAKVDIVQILAQLRDGLNRAIRDLSAFCEDQISKSWRCCDDLDHSSILQFSTVCEVQNAQRVKGAIERKIQECSV
jgi:hypothetical protein